MTPGIEAAGEIERMLAKPQLSRIHAHYAHYARPRCYAALVERA